MSCCLTAAAITRKTGRNALAAGLMMGVLAGPAAAGDALPWCTTRFSDQLQGIVSAQAGPAATEPFVIRCRGSLSASLRGQDGRLTSARLVLEQQSGADWVAVATGPDVVYAVTRPGIWRYTVIAPASLQGSLPWILRHSTPR